VVLAFFTFFLTKRGYFKVYPPVISLYKIMSGNMFNLSDTESNDNDMQRKVEEEEEGAD